MHLLHTRACRKETCGLAKAAFRLAKETGGLSSNQNKHTEDRQYQFLLLSKPNNLGHWLTIHFLCLPFTTCSLLQPFTITSKLCSSTGIILYLSTLSLSRTISITFVTNSKIHSNIKAILCTTFFLISIPSARGISRYFRSIPTNNVGELQFAFGPFIPSLLHSQ